MTFHRNATALIAVLLGCAICVAPAGAARTRTVAIEQVDFAPGTVRISRGDSVRWIWRDAPTPHNVRSRGSARFTGSGTKTTGRHTVRFTRAGTYRYVCTVHIGMDGRIVVR